MKDMIFTGLVVATNYAALIFFFWLSYRLYTRWISAFALKLEDWGIHPLWGVPVVLVASLIALIFYAWAFLSAGGLAMILLTLVFGPPPGNSGLAVAFFAHAFLLMHFFVPLGLLLGLAGYGIYLLFHPPSKHSALVRVAKAVSRDIQHLEERGGSMSERAASSPLCAKEGQGLENGCAR